MVSIQEVRTLEDRPDPYEKARAIFRKHGGALRTSEAIRAGVHPRTLYAMRDAGELFRLSRGFYRLSDLPPLGNPDLVSVSRRAPDGVICLISALAFHNITTQVPHVVYLAVARASYPPKINRPPVRVFRFSCRSFDAGVETRTADGAQLRIYSPEKTLADCFKYRNKIGLDVAIEALRLYRERKQIKADAIIRFANICRVHSVMRPYLEAIL